MKKLAGFLIVLALTARAYAGVTATPETLATQFIAAVNDTNAKMQRAIIHPLSFDDLSAIQEQFVNEALARDFGKTIPKDATVKVKSLEESTLPFEGMMEWPVKPTHQLEIEYSSGENSSTTMIRFIVQEKKEWFIVVPMLNAENLKKYEAKKKSRPVDPLDKE